MMTAQSLFLAFCVVMPCRECRSRQRSQSARWNRRDTHHLCKGSRLLLLHRLRLHLNRLRTPSRLRLRRRSPDLGSVLRRRVRELVTDRSRSVRVLLRLRLRMLRESARVRRPRRGGTHPRGGFDLADRVLPPERARRVRPARALTERLRGRRRWFVHRLRLGDVDRRGRTLRLAQRRRLLLWRLPREGSLELGGCEALPLLFRAVLRLRPLPNQPRLDVRVVVSPIQGRLARSLERVQPACRVGVAVTRRLCTQKLIPRELVSKNVKRCEGLTHPLIPSLGLFEVDRPANSHFIKVPERKLRGWELTRRRLLGKGDCEALVLFEVAIRAAQVPFGQRCVTSLFVSSRIRQTRATCLY
jgi:hypothetical protein